MEVKSRHHLRSDAVSDLEDTLAERFGISIDAGNYERVVLVDAPFEVVLADGDPVAFRIEGEFAPTVRGANEYPQTKRIVAVDAGAISFVSDGANVMRPGIVDADDAIEAGEIVTVAEETHGKTLAIGRAAVDGAEMVGESGMVVESIHHVGDDLYDFTP
ncbi:RNA-binding protein [Halobacteriales archaeon QS_3_64_16]|nr:MAG: RNA-binding protein [Halobacteriales archaeon QS_3_64_16]